MRFTFVVPGSAVFDRDTLAGPSLARLATWSASRTSAPGVDAATLQALGAAPTADGRSPPVAPAAALGAGFEPGPSAVLAADPVSLVAGRDDVRLAARIDDLDAANAAAIVAALDAHFAADGLRFHAPRPDALFVTSATRPALDTVPLPVALGGFLSAHPPRGADARLWLRWGTEIQMLLFAHPVNAARERAGRPAVNGLWFWGGGTLDDLGLVAPFRAHVADDRSGDLVRGLARHAGGETLRLPASFEAAVHAVPATRPAAHVVVALPPLGEARSLAWAERDWFAPAAEALARGRVASIVLATDRGVWTVPRPGFAARLRARLAPRRRPAPSA